VKTAEEGKEPSRDIRVTVAPGRVTGYIGDLGEENIGGEKAERADELAELFVPGKQRHATTVHRTMITRR